MHTKSEVSVRSQNYCSSNTKWCFSVLLGQQPPVSGRNHHCDQPDLHWGVSGATTDLMEPLLYLTACLCNARSFDQLEGCWNRSSQKLSAAYERISFVLRSKQYIYHEIKLVYNTDNLQTLFFSVVCSKDWLEIPIHHTPEIWIRKFILLLNTNTIQLMLVPLSGQITKVQGRGRHLTNPPPKPDKQVNPEHPPVSWLGWRTLTGGHETQLPATATTFMSLFDDNSKT